LATDANTELISSKELLARTGLSRATLNNYISLNLIPHPRIRRPETAGGPTKIGYFPVWVLDRIERIRQLKASGMRMTKIAAQFENEAMEKRSAAIPETRDQFPYQSIERVVFPALLVNERWEIIWINDVAEQELFRQQIRTIASPAHRNMFRLLLGNGLRSRFANWKDILRVHLRLAKRDLTEAAVEQLCRQVEACPFEDVKHLWREIEPLEDRPITQQELVLKPHAARESAHVLFSSEFREGTLLLYTPATMQLDHILNLLTGRERLIRPVLSRRIPSLTSLCILAGRIESGLRLRTALPPHEYFDLVNEIVMMSHQCFKEHGGTPGRSFHEGVVCFFLSPEDPLQEHLHQALEAASSLRQMTEALDKRWKGKKAWNNTLCINIGLHCGHEWLGSIPSSVAFEFTVMGDALMQTIKLSKFARGGAIWATKKVVENLLGTDRRRLTFGIRPEAGRERHFTPGIYSQVRELLHAEELDRRGLREIGHLAVTEIIHVQSEGCRRS
jgi:class 3 adenylate cyclase/DNA-binding transcriptional MerR regulator